MRVRFWGTRGGIAAPGPRTAKYGGNTSCVEVRADDGTLIVLDCGTGARALGLQLQRAAQPIRLNLFIGHTHWDHIQGFPFFTPAFLSETELNIYAPAGFQHNVEEALSGQMQYSYFPVTLRDLRSRIHFTELEEGFFRLGDVLVETQYLNHTAPTIAYRISSNGATVAYVTDHEPFWRPAGMTFHHPGDQRHIAFLKGADLIIHDAQYSDDEYRTKVGWGHSPIEYATDVAMAAGATHLALFHHDPDHDDEIVKQFEQSARLRVLARRSNLEVFAAEEGLELHVRGNGNGPAAAEQSALRRRPIAGGRVLVVSANGSEIASMTRLLGEDNLILLPVQDARAAQALAPEFMPDLAIIEGRLPDWDGIDLIQPLRDLLRQPNLPVVLLSENPDAETDLHIRNLEATDCLVKPFIPPMLRTRVRAWLSRVLAADSSALRAQADRQSPGESGTEEPARVSDKKEERGYHVTATSTYADVLAGMPLFQPLDRDQLLSLMARATEQDFHAGRVVVWQGEPAKTLYVILSGQVRVVEGASETPLADRFLAELGYGEVLGEIGVLLDLPRSATVVAVERTRCLVLPQDDFLRVLQDSAGMAVALSRVLAQRLHKTDGLLARYAPDPLTGLASRQAFHDQYRSLAAWARRRRSDVTLLLLDVMRLKNINDQYGYVAGDEVLRCVAEALLQATRNTDLVARYGGDEFVVLLVDAGYQYVDTLVSRVQEKLEQLAPQRGLPMTVRCNAGVATSRVPPESPEDLLREADQDMMRKRV
ncbi:MAG: diguanylate cyclase [Nitrospirae bacterium]|nr:diguanylate cyclase [Nitrospirota bacterium]